MMTSQSDNPGGETTQPEEPEADYTLRLSAMNSTLEVGKSVVADVSTTPYSAREDLTFTFSSSDTSVATVEKYSGNSFSCTIKAVGPGTATITAKDSNGIEATLTVTVNGTSTSTPGTSGSDDDYADIKDEIIELTNEVRAENGVGALTKSDLLMEIAQQRAEECAEMGERQSWFVPMALTIVLFLKSMGLTDLKCNMLKFFAGDEQTALRKQWMLG